MTDALRNHRLGGLLFETTPSAAPEVSLMRQDSIPSKVDLRPLCSPVENQLQVGSCAANAVVGALEYHQRKARAPQTDLSRLFVYYNARKLAGREGEDAGTIMSHVMASVMAFGACEEKLWPYIEAKWPERPPEDCYENALRYEAVQYARVPFGPACLVTLASGLPIVFGISLPSEYYDEAGQKGVMPIPGENLPEPGGGHAMLIVGYDIGGEHWLVRNSWGAGFADGGYFRLPFKTMQAYARPDSYWTFGAIEQASAGALKMTGPSVQKAVEITRAEAPQQAEDAIARLKKGLRTKLNTELEAAKKSLRERLRGPGVGGGY
jgi:hypothetical protein